MTNYNLEEFRNWLTRHPNHHELINVSWVIKGRGYYAPIWDETHYESLERQYKEQWVIKALEELERINAGAKKDKISVQLTQALQEWKSERERERERAK